MAVQRIWLGRGVIEYLLRITCGLPAALHLSGYLAWRARIFSFIHFTIVLEARGWSSWLTDSALVRFTSQEAKQNLSMINVRVLRGVE